MDLNGKLYENQRTRWVFFGQVSKIHHGHTMAYSLAGGISRGMIFVENGLEITRFYAECVAWKMGNLPGGLM